MYYGEINLNNFGQSRVRPLASNFRETNVSLIFRLSFQINKISFFSTF